MEKENNEEEYICNNAIGLGLVMVLVWSKTVIGIVVSIVGIVLLLCLIPFIKGLE